MSKLGSWGSREDVDKDAQELVAQMAIQKLAELPGIAVQRINGVRESFITNGNDMLIPDDFVQLNCTLDETGISEAQATDLVAHLNAEEIRVQGRTWIATVAKHQNGGITIKLNPEASV